MNESSTAAVVPRHSAEYANCLYPEDITPFTRKKLFLIVESNNSASFKVSFSLAPLGVFLGGIFNTIH